MPVITYDELAAGLEDAWVLAGLHDHEINETVNPELLERTYKAELFPEHPEPLIEGTVVPWVDVGFTWSPAQQLHAEGAPISPGVTDMTWTYTVDVRQQGERSDIELARAFHAAVRSAIRRIAPEMSGIAEYIAVEVRRGYRLSNERPAQAYCQLVGTNVTDLSDMWTERQPEALREALRDELMVVSALLHALGETFAPSGIGGYRAVDTA
ncbi:MAG: hypothetical protein H7Z42_11070 [Roseiflexaceae bacterium]|nr:hypothetical protein [Roseiflexaceae bacterium]